LGQHLIGQPILQFDPKDTVAGLGERETNPSGWFRPDPLNLATTRAIEKSQERSINGNDLVVVSGCKHLQALRATVLGSLIESLAQQGSVTFYSVLR
jgi:hypothetical protein